jgi:hypothetical protein
MTTQVLSGLVLALALEAVAATPAGPTAPINFLDNPNGGRARAETLTLYADTRCGAQFKGKTIGRHGGLWGVTKGPIDIPTGSRIMIAVNGADPTHYTGLTFCMTFARFTPEPGHVYDVRHAVIPGACILDIKDHATGKPAPSMEEVTGACDKVE